MFSAFVISLCLLLCISESSQQTLLVASDSGIKTLSLTSLTVTSLHNQAAKAIDFRYNSKDVYFISNSSDQIFYSYYSDYSQRLSDPVPRVTSQSVLSSLAVDWVSYKLYYGSPSEGTLLKETLRPSTPEEVASQAFELHNFVLDPYEKLIFFNMQRHLFSVTLGDAVVNRHDLRSSGLTNLVQMALDLHSKEIYMVCQQQTDNQWVLGVKDYSRSAETSLVYVGDELQGVRALAVYHGLLIWASPCDDAFCLYSCQRDSCQKDNLTTAWRTYEVINDIKYYTPLAQTPNLQAACLLCSHGCLNASAECVCPEGMEVEYGGAECRKKTPSWNQKMQDLLDGLLDNYQQCIDSLLTTTKPYWYPCAGLLLGMLLCCICLLATIPCTKPIEDADDNLTLSEMHHLHCPNRQSRQ